MNVEIGTEAAQSQNRNTQMGFLLQCDPGYSIKSPFLFLPPLSVFGCSRTPPVVTDAEATGVVSVPAT
jgi:hypothetical protein